MDSRRMYRRSRRNRKTRYRKSRFLNRRNSIRKDRYCPTLVSKYYRHEIEIEFCKKILPIKDLVMETAQFDTQLMEKPWLQEHKWAYQKGVNYGYANAREHALVRDKYTCQCCGKKNCRVEAHHIVFRSKNGSNDLENYITLCEDCHKAVHLGKIDLKLKGKRKSNLRYATQMSIIRSMLLKKYPDAIETFGYVTKANRENLGLKKAHYLDACVIASGGLEFKPSDTLYRKRCVAKQDRQLCKGIRGEKKIPTGKVFGFKKFDKVRYLGRECFIKGRRTSGWFVLMDIDGSSIDFRNIGGKQNPSYRFIERINTRSSVLCVKNKNQAYDEKGSWVLIYTGTNHYVKISELVELALSIDGISPLTSVYCVNDNYDSFNELLAHINENSFPFINTIYPDDII